MRIKSIAVMAGTPVDTQMGITLLERRVPGLQLLPIATAPDPKRQTLFQFAPQEQRDEILRSHIQHALNQGAQALLVYCNSLSASADFLALCGESGLPVVTPLLCYSHLARHSKRVGVMAANNQSLYGIERVILEANPSCDIFGISLLPVVMAIEQGIEPAHIIERFGLRQALGFFETCAVETVLLGCTHFSSLDQELQSKTPLPVLNPDDFMLEGLEAL